MYLDMNKIDALIRQGELKEARFLLDAWKAHPKKRPRPQILEAAQFYRRLGDAYQGLLLLRRFVRTQGRTVAKPLVEEKLEYAICLIQSGAREEGKSLLSEIDSKAHPEVNLHFAFALFAEWNYKAAIPSLEKFCSYPHSDDYKLLIGQVNLAAAYVAILHANAKSLLKQLLDKTKEQQWSRLHTALSELYLQYLVLSKASSDNHEFKTIATSDDFLWFQKWKWVQSLSDPNPSEKARFEQYQYIKHQALEKNDFETLRDCDFYWAQYKKDSLLMAQVFFGTPFSEFRQKIISSFNNLVLPEFFIMGLPGAENIFDFYGDQKFEKDLFGKVTLFKFFHCLTRDYYRPFSFAEVHEFIFPDRFYHPVYSNQIIQQLCSRLRALFSKHRFPARVVSKFGRLHIELPANAAIKIRKISLETPDRNWVLYGAFFTQKPISILQFQTFSRLPRRTAQRILATFVKLNLIAHSGNKKSSRYRIVA